MIYGFYQHGTSAGASRLCSAVRLAPSYVIPPLCARHSRCSAGASSCCRLSGGALHIDVIP